MVVDEVNVNSQMLLFNVSDMLECRQKAVEEINALYGTNITVDLSDEYKFIKDIKNDDTPEERMKEGANDENNDR